MHSPSAMTQPSILPNSSLLTPTPPYIFAGELPLAQISPIENREVISMV